MRFTLLFLIMAASASAQSDTGKLTAQGFRGALAGLAPIPEKDQSALLYATAELLSRHVTFRPDGTAASVFTFSGRRHVEWRRLVVNNISLQSINEADRLNGTSKRYFVSLSCDAHRSWDAKANAWGKWYPIGHVLFPAGFMFDWNNNQWTARQTDQLKHFIPGPGPSIAEPKPTPKPAAKPDGLPPGMSRGR